MIPGPDHRFQRLPVVENCKTSGLPASVLEPLPGDAKPVPISKVSKTKYDAADQGKLRLFELVKRRFEKAMMPDDLDKLERRFKDTSWIAIIHADGNGIGQIFMDFAKHCGGKDGSARDYLDKMRRFSCALDMCTESAFGRALEKMGDRLGGEKKSEKISLPVLPLVIGGDDLTVICDGQYAVRMTRDFLEFFEEETSKIDHLDGIIPEIAEKAFGAGRLGICAGIAIVKPHFPFHSAYKLAVSLLDSAKSVKTKVLSNKTPFPTSALDYHVLYDSSGVELNQIRKKLIVDEGSTKLFSRPYIVSNLEGLPQTEWVSRRTFSLLKSRVEAMTAEDKDTKRRRLPNTQLHELRGGLFRGRKEADAIFGLIKGRYKDAGIDILSGDGESLFCQEDREYHTGLLDSLDLVEFMK